MQRRRDFLRAGAVAAGTVSLGAGFWRGALAAGARPGPGPYGPLRDPDARGLRLPDGFRSRVVARAGEPVGDTTHDWHLFPDGQATYPTPDGGWILVSNSEAPAALGGGAGAIRFDRRGRIRDAYRILGDTNLNCSGGATPWGTWLSCEEHEAGRVWECDPRGRRRAVVRPAMGVFKHEAAAADRRGRRVYLTEDLVDGCLYRFTPRKWPSLAHGKLEVALVRRGGGVRWREVPDPAARSTPTREQVPGATRFARGEGIWFDSGTVYVATTADNRVHAYDTRRRRIDVIYDGAARRHPPFTGVDNITVSRAGDLYVCEDNGGEEFDIGLITPRRRLARFVTATGPDHRGSEFTGVVFSPSGSRMYVSSQRYKGGGAIFEISGPFRTAPRARRRR